ncbi:MAG: hypothetical protein ACLTWE_08445 [Dysgonomonas mossii]|uniref:hypothetical protein n=1 Tax=Dysgonomonas mossii TaxID=163665 RepID=UPI003992B590
MKSKILFWILAVLVFGSLLTVGFVFFRTDLYKFLLIEGIAILAIIFFITLYYRLIKPYQIISDGMELLKNRIFRLVCVPFPIAKPTS